MAAIAAMKFRFHEEEDASDTASRLAGLMHIREPQHLLVADYLHRDWRPELVGAWGACHGMAAAAAARIMHPSCTRHAPVMHPSW
jgi:hypothetical protein